jgi:hypothetical protein
LLLSFSKGTAPAIIAFLLLLASPSLLDHSHHKTRYYIFHIFKAHLGPITTSKTTTPSSVPFYHITPQKNFSYFYYLHYQSLYYFRLEILGSSCAFSSFSPASKYYRFFHQNGVHPSFLSTLLPLLPLKPVSGSTTCK